jgi:hypothetical protein
MQEGWIKLHRQAKDWQWYKKPFMFHVFFHLVMSANHEDQDWQGINVKRGQLITGRRLLSKDTGISEKSIRTILDRLSVTKEIIVKSANKYSIITICNYDKYQPSETEYRPATGQQPASNRPAEVEILPNDVKKIPAKNVSKYVKNEKKIPKKPFGPFLNVFLSDEEKKKLTQKFNGRTEDKIEKLSLYLESTGKKYKSHYATILNWSRKDPQVQEEKW